MGQTMSDSVSTPDIASVGPNEHTAADCTTDDADAPDPDPHVHLSDPVPAGRTTRWQIMPVGSSASTFRSHCFLQVCRDTYRHHLRGHMAHIVAVCRQSPFKIYDLPGARVGRHMADSFAKPEPTHGTIAQQSTPIFTSTAVVPIISHRNVLIKPWFSGYGLSSLTSSRQSWRGYSVVNFSHDTGDSTVITQRLIRLPKVRLKPSNQASNRLFESMRPKFQHETTLQSTQNLSHTAIVRTPSSLLDPNQGASRGNGSLVGDTTHDDIEELVTMMKTHRVSENTTSHHHTPFHTSAMHEPPSSPTPRTLKFSSEKNNAHLASTLTTPCEAPAVPAPPLPLTSSSQFKFSFSVHAPSYSPNSVSAPATQADRTVQLSASPQTAVAPSNPDSTRCQRNNLVPLVEKSPENPTSQTLATISATEASYPVCADNDATDNEEYDDDAHIGYTRETFLESANSTIDSGHLHLQHRKILPLPKPRWKRKVNGPQVQGSEFLECPASAPKVVSNSHVDRNEAEAHFPHMASADTREPLPVYDSYSVYQQDKQVTDSIDTSKKNDTKKVTDGSEAYTVDHEVDKQKVVGTMKQQKDTSSTSPDNVIVPQGQFVFTMDASAEGKGKHLSTQKHLPQSKTSFNLSSTTNHVVPSTPSALSQENYIPVAQSSETGMAISMQNGHLPHMHKPKTVDKHTAQTTQRQSQDKGQRRGQPVTASTGMSKKGKKTQRKNEYDHSYTQTNPLSSDLSVVQSANPDEWICLFCQYQIFCNGLEAARRKSGYYKRLRRRQQRLSDAEARRVAKKEPIPQCDSDELSQLP